SAAPEAGRGERGGATAAAQGGHGAPVPEDGAAVLEVELRNQHGLHARPAALLTRTAAGFDAEVTVNGVDAASLLRVLSLGLDRGATATFAATGPQAREAIDAIRELAEGGFGDA
ncbi:HPr family phosphocarrier protein, partial [Agrococcus sp. HG114]|uniref:HPr family phosphocarrier protein n=1 Tax=Agrococcus sp. HG114 TaxID=2969757 RepID=UPI00215A8483